MALTASQRLQVNRLGTVDATWDIADRYGINGLVEALSSPITLADEQRYQFNRLGIVDATITLGDRYGINGIVRPIAGGNLVEFFDLTWTLDPNISALLLPTTNDGSIAGAISPFISGLTGGTPTPVTTDAIFQITFEELSPGKVFTEATRSVTYSVVSNESSFASGVRSATVDVNTRQIVFSLATKETVIQ